MPAVPFDPSKYTPEKPYRFPRQRRGSRTRYSVYATCWECGRAFGSKDRVVSREEADAIEREARDHHLKERVSYRFHGASRYQCWTLNPAAHTVSIQRTRRIVVGDGM